MGKDKVRTTLMETTWNVVRTGRLEEVALPGGSLRFRVKVWDAGRDAFITQWFNDPTPAQEFLRRLQTEGEARGVATASDS